MPSSLVPDGIEVLLPPLSSISSSVTSHFLRYALRGLLKYDADVAEAGSADERTFGRGVVLRLRGVAEGFEPGLALPLLLAMVVLLMMDACVGVALRGTRRGED